MPAVVERVIQSVQELIIEFLNSNNSETFHIPNQLLFRGESSDQYKLLPSVFREERQEKLISFAFGSNFINLSSQSTLDYVHTEIGHIDLEYRLMFEFYHRVNAQGLPLPRIDAKWMSRFQMDAPLGLHIALRDTIWIPPELVELVALLQHYGMPTRMLDWSTNLLVALYFAAKGAAESRFKKGHFDAEYMVLWVMRKFPTSDEVNVPFFQMRVVVPSYSSNPNLRAQKGVLTYIPFDLKDEKIRTKRICQMPLDEQMRGFYGNDKGIAAVLTRIKIPIKQCFETLRILDSFGINSASIFPDYHNIVHSIEERELMYFDMKNNIE